MKQRLGDLGPGVFAAPLLAATGLLVSCAIASPEQIAQRQALAAQVEKTRPTCTGEAECKVKWDAAQLWVVHNCGFKIQTVTDVLIETYNPSSSSVSLAARVTKEPMGGGSYRFVIALWCDNIFGCSPDPLDAAYSFNVALSAASP